MTDLPIAAPRQTGASCRGLLLIAVMAWAVPGLAAAPLMGRVIYVTDGDTLTIDAGDTRYRIRLQEIDAPERDQPGGAEARAALSRRVDRKYVRVDVEGHDDYGRTVGKVWLGNEDVNRDMVRDGHAWVYRRYLKDPSLLADEAAARDAGRGLWASTGAVPPWQWRHSSHHSTPPPSRAASAGGCAIKGNINRRGERIYHEPDDPNYRRTRIDTARGERWFCSVEEAERAGWRSPR